MSCYKLFNGIKKQLAQAKLGEQSSNPTLDAAGAAGVDPIASMGSISLNRSDYSLYSFLRLVAVHTFGCMRRCLSILHQLFYTTQYPVQETSGTLTLNGWI